jgi:bifunctional non-homologous end joining protein LigD
MGDAASTKLREYHRRTKLPAIASPMLATLIDAPFDDDRWLFEIKWDGFRALLAIDEKRRVTLTSRNGLDLLARFPELRTIGQAFAKVPALVDGEIVSLDERGRSSFQRLQGHLNRQPSSRGTIAFVAFDVLHVEGHDLRRTPLVERKAKLASIVEKGAPHVLFSSHVVGRGKELFALAKKSGLEGIIGKRRDSLYVEKRTRDWVKIKAQHGQECVIGGYTDPQGSRGGFGSLVVGLYDDEQNLHYVGNVGTGFTRDTIELLTKKMSALSTTNCPFFVRPKKHAKTSHWVKPELVAEVRFTEWTDDHLMRHPAFLGLRLDKRAKDCKRERQVRAATARGA